MRFTTISFIFSLVLALSFTGVVADQTIAGDLVIDNPVIYEDETISVSGDVIINADATFDNVTLHVGGLIEVNFNYLEINNSKIYSTGGAGSDHFIRFGYSTGNYATIENTLINSGVKKPMLVNSDSNYFNNVEIVTTNGNGMTLAGHNMVIENSRIDSKMTVYESTDITIQDSTIRKITVSLSDRVNLFRNVIEYGEWNMNGHYHNIINNTMAWSGNGGYFVIEGGYHYFEGNNITLPLADIDMIGVDNTVFHRNHFDARMFDIYNGGDSGEYNSFTENYIKNLMMRQNSISYSNFTENVIDDFELRLENRFNNFTFNDVPRGLLPVIFAFRTDRLPAQIAYTALNMIEAPVLNYQLEGEEVATASFVVSAQEYIIDLPSHIVGETFVDVWGTDDDGNYVKLRDHFYVEADTAHPTIDTSNPSNQTVTESSRSNFVWDIADANLHFLELSFDGEVILTEELIDYTSYQLSYSFIWNYEPGQYVVLLKVNDTFGHNTFKQHHVVIEAHVDETTSTTSTTSSTSTSSTTEVKTTPSASRETSDDAPEVTLPFNVWFVLLSLIALPILNKVHRN